MYEKIVKTFGKYLKVEKLLSEEERIRLRAAIELLNLKVTPEEIVSCAVFVSLIFFFIAMLSIILGSIAFLITFIIIGIALFFYIKNYPFILLNRIFMQETSELLLAVFFIVVYMRMNPNLEKAIEFASRSLSGPLKRDFEKLLWNIQHRKYSSAIEALDEYCEKWREKVPEFVDAVRLIEASLYETSEERRLALLDRAVDRMLEGSFDRANRFAIKLKQPINAIYMLGIVLPLLVTVLIPVFAIFAGDIFKIDHIFLLYNILLPGIVFLIIQDVLSKRPVFYVRSVESHPNWPKEDCIRIGKREINIWFLIFVFYLVFIVFPSIYFVVTFKNYPSTTDLYISFIPIMLFGFSASYVFKTYVNQRIKEIKEIEEAEKEFVDVSFQLGNRIAEGYPAETAILKVAITRKKPSKFLSLIVERIRKFGLDLEDACFHPRYGVFRYFLSPILKSGMRILIEAAKKSYREAASAIANFSRHLKNMERIEMKIEDLLGETLSSMYFNISFITPILLAVVVGITALLCVVLVNVKESIETIFQMTGGVEAGFGAGFLMGILMIATNFPLPVFQIIIGFYFIEVLFLISYMIAEIERPGSKFYFYQVLSKMILIPLLIYSLVGLAASFSFIALAKVAIQIGEIT